MNLNMVLNGVKNTLQLVNDNWTTIVIIIGLGLACYKKYKEYSILTTDQKIELAWDSVKESMLALVTQAELNYNDWVKAGAIKRSEVIKQIFDSYPILNLITDRDAVTAKIDKLICDALEQLKVVIETNNVSNKATNSPDTPSEQ